MYSWSDSKDLYGTFHTTIRLGQSEFTLTQQNCIKMKACWVWFPKSQGETY